MNLRQQWVQWGRAVAVLGLVSTIGLVSVIGLVGAAAPASAGSGVTVNASVDGQPIGDSSQNRPVKLLPRQASLLTLEVTNGSASTIEVRKVRLQGQVIGLTFFEYDTSVSMTVAPGATESRRLVLDLSGLDGQATGLIPGSVKVLDDNRHVLAAQSGVVDVRGSLRSVYGLFGLGVAFLTALSFLGALVGLARHRLPANRWRRGLRFLTPGLGLGLVVNFTLSATRVFVPEIGRWVTITALCAAILFGLGYLTPTPDLEEDLGSEETTTEVIDEFTVVAIAARPAHPALPGQPAADALPAAPAPSAAFGSSTEPAGLTRPGGPAESAGPSTEPAAPARSARSAEPAPAGPARRPAEPAPAAPAGSARSAEPAEPAGAGSPAGPAGPSDGRVTLPAGFTAPGGLVADSPAVATPREGGPTADH